MGSNLCIRAEKRSGERVRQALLRLGLYDRSRKIREEGGSILIPILRPLEAACTLEGEVTTADLPPSAKRPRTLSEALGEAVPRDLHALLPRSYDAVGDILVVESLSDGLLPYRGEIGKALLRLNPGMRTVMLKTGKVAGEFRVPRLEVVAGEEKWETVHSEYGIRVKVDLSKVYYSPRLGWERFRVASSVADGETVVDMFSGVGPFSLMIAKCAMAHVYSIDLNPDAIRLLSENVSLNRLCGRVEPICGDARAAAARLGAVADRVIMNLPGRSLEFLDAAAGVLKPGGGMLHLYVFAKEDPLRGAESALRRVADLYFASYNIRGTRVVKPTAPREWQVALDVWAEPRSP